MGLVKIQNISPHSPQGEILEVTEAKAKELVKLKKARFVVGPEMQTNTQEVKLKKIDTKL